MAYMYLLTAALVIAGWLVVFIGLRRTLNRTCTEFRPEFQRQMDSLSARLEVLQRAAGTRTPTAPISAVAASGKMESSAGNAVPAITAQAQAPQEITPETLATITEAVTGLLGRKVRIRSVKVLPTPDAIVNPWAQHGRAVVQASHDFSQRSRP
jgi:hypothetical protein